MSDTETELRENILETIPKIYCSEGCDGHGTAIGGFAPDDYYPIQCEYCYTVRFEQADTLMELVVAHTNKGTIAALNKLRADEDEEYVSAGELNHMIDQEIEGLSTS